MPRTWSFIISLVFDVPSAQTITRAKFIFDKAEQEVILDRDLGGKLSSFFEKLFEDLGIAYEKEDRSKEDFEVVYRLN